VGTILVSYAQYDKGFAQVFKEFEPFCRCVSDPK